MNLLGLDPGRDKCGLAVMNQAQQLLVHQVIDSGQAIAKMQQMVQEYEVGLIVIGDGTTSKEWQEKIKANLPRDLEVVTVNETNSTLEARDRYWQLYPPQGLQKLIPSGLRLPSRPVDDIVAILLIERYLNQG